MHTTIHSRQLNISIGLICTTYETLHVLRMHQNIVFPSVQMINSWKSSNFLNYFTHEGKQLMRFKKSKTNDNALTLAYDAHICIML